MRESNGENRLLDNIFIISCTPDDLSKIDKSNGQKLSILFKKTCLAYPDENILFSNPEIFRNIIKTQRYLLEREISIEEFNEEFFNSHIKALQMYSMNLLIVPLPHNHVLGLMFNQDANPYDYREEVIRLLQEYLLEKFLKKFKERNKTTLLLTLFIDLRKYSDEILRYNEISNKLMVYENKIMIKVFVYGIDYAGKSSLMRLLSTGRFEPNYFLPTKRFRITDIKLSLKVKLILWDMPGQKIFREDWLRGAQASNLLLFVLDSADKERYKEAKDEFW
ncbi:MAG: ADP-ribosylation factor-like protein, partial [Promethearchaeota archaeon]